MKFFQALYISLFLLPNLLRSATITSSGLSSSWNSSTTWVGGVVPSITDDVVIASGHSVNNTSSGLCANLLISSNATVTVSAGSLAVRGDFTNDGVITGSGVLRMLCVNNSNFFSSSTVINSPFLTLRFTTASGRTYFISAGTVISKIGTINIDGQTAGGFVQNDGQVTVVSSSPKVTSATFVNGSSGTFTTNYNFSLLSGGAVDFSAVGNTCIYSGTTWNSVLNTTYSNLTFSNGTTTTIATKSAVGNFTVNNNFVLESNVRLSCNGFNITCGGNWIHNGGNTSPDLINQGQIIFSGSSSSVSRVGGTERLENVQVNTTGGSLTLGSDLQCGNITLNSGSLDLSSSNFTCHITGNMVANAGSSINPRNGKFRFIGSSAQTISGAGFPTFYDLIIRNNSGVTVTGSCLITNLLTDSVGNIGTSGTGTIRMVASSATQYGRIGPVLGSLSGTGWVVDAFVPAGSAKWYVLTTPISGNLLKDWDDDTRFYMSGVGGNDGNAGSFVSVRVFTNGSSNTFTNITSINHSLVKARGYRIFISDNLTSLTAPLVYNSVGLPNFLTVQSPALVTTGTAINSVGNPYACPINFSALATNNSNINSAGYYILNGSTWQTFAGGVLPPNQGFFVIATSGGTLNFSEDLKNTSSLTSLQRTPNPNNRLTISVSNQINEYSSETTVGLDENAGDGYDLNLDLPYSPSIIEESDNIWTLADDKQVSINNFNRNDVDKRISLVVKAGVLGYHTLKFTGISGFNDYNCIWLEDLQNGNKINLNEKSTYHFSCSDTISDYRFTIHLEYKYECLTKLKEESSGELDESTLVFNNGSDIAVKFNLSEGTPIELTVYNMIGQEVIREMSFNVTNEAVKIPLPQQHQFYVIKIKSGNQIVVKRIFY